MAMFGIKTVVVVTLVAVMAFFLNCPAPQMSDALQEWKGRGQFFNFNGHQIFYRDDIGKAEDGSVLICLHGYPTFSYDWSKMWEQLTVRFSRVIAADFLGFGFSDKPDDIEYTVSMQADIIESMLKEFKIRRVHVIAHDFGDTVAQELLHRFETREAAQDEKHLIIETVCLLNGGIFPETNFPRISQRLLLEPWIAPVVKRLMNFAFFKRGFGEILGPRTKPTDEEYSDFWTALLWNDGHLIADRVMQFVLQRRQYRDKWVGALQQTSVPLHVIYGPADPVNPPGFVDHYKEIVPNPSITVLSEGIGHYPQWEDHEATTRAYFTFLVMPHSKKPAAEPVSPF